MLIVSKSATCKFALWNTLMSHLGVFYHIDDNTVITICTRIYDQKLVKVLRLTSL